MAPASHWPHTRGCSSLTWQSTRCVSSARQRVHSVGARNLQGRRCRGHHHLLAHAQLVHRHVQLLWAHPLQSARHQVHSSGHRCKIILDFRDKFLFCLITNLYYWIHNMILVNAVGKCDHDYIVHCGVCDRDCSRSEFSGRCLSSEHCSKICPSHCWCKSLCSLRIREKILEFILKFVWNLLRFWDLAPLFV